MLVWEPANTWSQTYWPTGQNRQVPRKSLQGHTMGCSSCRRARWLGEAVPQKDFTAIAWLWNTLHCVWTPVSEMLSETLLWWPLGVRVCLWFPLALSLLPSWERREDRDTLTHMWGREHTHVMTGTHTHTCEDGNTHTQSHELYPASPSRWPITPQTMSLPSLGCFHKLLKEPEDSFSLYGPSFLCPSSALTSE